MNRSFNRFGWMLKQAQAIMVIAAAAAEAAKVGAPAEHNAAEVLGLAFTRSLSLQSSTAEGGQSTTPNALFMLQTGIFWYSFAEIG